jgi:hypothetical protein
MVSGAVNRNKIQLTALLSLLYVYHKGMFHVKKQNFRLQDRQCMYNVTWRRVRATIAAVE